MGRGPQPLRHRGAPGAIEFMAESRFEFHRRECWFDDQLREVVDHVLKRRRLTAPPGSHRWQRQRLAQQAFADGGQKAQKRRRFKNAGAERIGDQYVARARRRDQAGDAEGRVGAQGGRIAILIVEPAQQRVDALQTLQGF